MALGERTHLRSARGRLALMLLVAIDPRAVLFGARAEAQAVLRLLRNGRGHGRHAVLALFVRHAASVVQFHIGGTGGVKATCHSRPFTPPRAVYVYVPWFIVVSELRSTVMFFATIESASAASIRTTACARAQALRTPRTKKQLTRRSPHDARPRAHAARAPHQHARRGQHDHCLVANNQRIDAARGQHAAILRRLQRLTILADDSTDRRA